jgi:hypothetical protein
VSKETFWSTPVMASSSNNLFTFRTAWCVCNLDSVNKTTLRVSGDQALQERLCIIPFYYTERANPYAYDVYTEKLLESPQQILRLAQWEQHATYINSHNSGDSWHTYQANRLYLSSIIKINLWTATVKWAYVLHACQP